ncbi:endo-alpha-N-acetylgalactosaminidase family protein [Amycolatopsis anabasis]|uniref:endo-alpha-N-acetylgalactosaminidase family protein n=1 Tax=Amycolatopsis anabasis TaxID=1840409 RepID=UPI00131D5EEB|nr:endo-alpha-N-acetylgalactosaminidase family protein [Amycolatopsis anabasis]
MPARVRPVVLLAAALATTGLIAAPAPSQAADQPAELRISSPELVVDVGAAFPYVRRYTDRATGAGLDGRVTALDSITINGSPHRVTGAGSVGPDGAAHYTLAIADAPGASVEASLRVRGRAVTFRIDRVTETPALRVGTIDIPGHDLVSVASGQPGASTAFTTLDPDSTRTADRFAAVTPATAADPAPVGASYAIVHTGQLAAAIETNSVYDKPSGPTNRDAARFWHQARREAGDATRVGVWSGQWTYRGDTAAVTEELPWAKVVITPDANGDGVVDWQDGALAFRDIAITPNGAGETADRVITHIPFNFASQATHPFLRTLDDVKRISLSTDGLGQLAILKGYGSEGHDSGHPDYGGDYNTRAGGLGDLNTLLREGKRWGANFGVHVNATESYPEAKAFDEKLVNPARKGWNWLDQSYEIDQRRDNASGDLAKRFQQLRDETDPNLKFLYIDVYRSYGWVAEHMLRSLRAQGWQVGTEWSDKLERSALWSHWANDLDYGGATNKGLNSQIIRFIRNGQKDVWNNHPILGNTRIEEFEGWTNEVDWNTFYRNIWTNNLPAKFLQHYQIQRWNAHDIAFSGGVRGSDAAGKREFFVGDAKVLDGDRYLLPWQSGGETKLYHYNPAGGRTEWTLPAQLAGARRLTVYRLTDTGRKLAATVPVRGGKVTVTAEPGVPYVLFPDRLAPRQADPRFGEGSPVTDPGFNAGDLRAWQPRGAVSIQRTERGQRVARFGAGAGALEQRLGALAPGTYSASAWVEVEPGKRRHAGISVRAGREPARSAFVESSTAKNLVAADDKHDTHFQRVRVLFDVPPGGARPLLRIAAGEGAAAVRVDDVRVVRTQAVAKPGALVFEDFEHVDQGWWPFVKGDAGGSTDPRTHLAELHAPYTQRGWNGKLVDDVLSGGWSLKAHEENAGLVYRTVPQSVRFVPGHRYRVEFDYQSGVAGQYQWITGVDNGTNSVELHRTPLGEQRATARFAQEFTADQAGEYWVGLRRLPGDVEQADVIMDNFTVVDLGAVPR